MDSVNVTWDVNISSGSENIPLIDMGIESAEEWFALTEDEQRDKLQEALDDLPERTCMIVNNW